MYHGPWAIHKQYVFLRPKSCIKKSRWCTSLKCAKIASCSLKTNILGKITLLVPEIYFVSSISSSSFKWVLCFLKFKKSAILVFRLVFFIFFLPICLIEQWCDIFFIIKKLHITTNSQSKLSNFFLKIRLIPIPKQLKSLSPKSQRQPPLQYQQPRHNCHWFYYELIKTSRWFP